jgi:hypothetical protein
MKLSFVDNIERLINRAIKAQEASKSLYERSCLNLARGRPAWTIITQELHAKQYDIQSHCVDEIIRLQDLLKG